MKTDLPLKTESRIRILQVVQSLDFGGLERVVIDLVNNLDRDRFQCDIICLRDFGRNSDLVINPETTIDSFGLGRGKSLALPWRIARCVQQRGYDILHSHDTSPLLYTALARLWHPRCIHIYTEHSGIYSCLPRHRIMIGAALLAVTHGVMVSKDLQQYYQRRFKTLCPHLSVIYNGLHSEQKSVSVAEIRNIFAIPRQVPLVGTAVRFYPQKGLRYLLQAVPKVLAVLPETRFILIGDGVEREALEKAAVDMGVANQVIFAGYRTDVRQLLRGLDLYVLPSLWEGLPLALIEAMLADTPIVATAVGGNKEMIEHGIRGLLVAPQDSDGLAEAIISLLNDDELRRRLARNGREFADEQFSLANMINKYSKLYQEMVTKNC